MFWMSNIKEEGSLWQTLVAPRPLPEVGGRALGGPKETRARSDLPLPPSERTLASLGQEAWRRITGIFLGSEVERRDLVSWLTNPPASASGAGVVDDQPEEDRNGPVWSLGPAAGRLPVQASSRTSLEVSEPNNNQKVTFTKASDPERNSLTD